MQGKVPSMLCYGSISLFSPKKLMTMGSWMMSGRESEGPERRGPVQGTLNWWGESQGSNLGRLGSGSTGNMGEGVMTPPYSGLVESTCPALHRKGLGSFLAQ